jgi:putative transcriptional regulator
MAKPTSKTTQTMTGEELGRKLLQSVREMQAGKAARATQVTLNDVTTARLRTGLSQAQFAKALRISPARFKSGNKAAANPPVLHRR